MSVILITDHNENIYDSTKKSTTYHKKSPRYVSKFREPIKLEEKSKLKQKPYGIMGLPQQPPPNPEDFLKKHTREHKALRQSQPHHDRKINLPPVPPTVQLLKEYNSRQVKPKKNFIVNNIKYVIHLKPKEPDKKVVIDCHGVSKLLTGLEPRYIYEKTFGKVPEYLERLIEQKERKIQSKKDTSGTEQPKCRYITRQEREVLLAGLKKNWEELQTHYQRLPILTDTIPKIHRKSKLEADLKQLEKDIVLLERHPYIYVYEENELN